MRLKFLVSSVGHGPTLPLEMDKGGALPHQSFDVQDIVVSRLSVTTVTTLYARRQS
ncbi:MAG: hypothetical protein KZQ96_16190 [Candidatus Thiodiazotropha sp. (ex Lucinoma borealis)]|nr:hypothetical protein [Candidatus Thiodiazotropha sp. (ex Lucinoma borealis)]